MTIIKKSSDMSDVDHVELEVGLEFTIKNLQKMAEDKNSNFFMLLTTALDNGGIGVKVVGRNSDNGMLLSTYKRIDQLVEHMIMETAKEIGDTEPLDKERINMLKRKALDSMDEGEML